MRSRYPSSSTLAYSFGPGPWTPAIKAIIVANVTVFVITYFLPALQVPLWLTPQDVVHGQVWRLVTYMFLHAGVMHLLFNMLFLWMFGVDLERMWGTRNFAKYYFVTGVAAALTTIAVSFVPLFGLGDLYFSRTVGASGAVVAVLLAYGLYFPNREIFIYGIFPIRAKYLLLILGALSLFSAGNIAHSTHVGGALAGYVYLKGGLRGGRIHLIAEVKYRYLKWRINRMRKRFDVHSGGRANDVNRRVH
jgi:membrane associated rhomboid family serine protease